MVVGPHIHQSSSEFASVVYEDVLGRTVARHQSIEGLDHVFSAQANACIDRQRRSCEYIDHGEHPDFPPLPNSSATKSIVHT